MARTVKFPKTLYVKIEEDGDENYFVSFVEIGELAELGETVPVGVYELKGAGEVTTESFLTKFSDNRT